MTLRGKGIMSRKKCLYLIGFMGTGKTSIGKLLSEQLECRFIDTDSVIEEQEQTTISEIFRIKGEASFREMEKRVLKSLTEKYKGNGFVMSTGGGMPCVPENLHYMRQKGRLIYIKSSIDDIMERVKESNTRPLIHRLEKKGDVREGLKSLLEERERYYSTADIAVTNNKKDAAVDIVKSILEQLCE
jgi:shikimate kinase